MERYLRYLKTEKQANIIKKIFFNGCVVSILAIFAFYDRLIHMQDYDITIISMLVFMCVAFLIAIIAAGVENSKRNSLLNYYSRAEINTIKAILYQRVDRIEKGTSYFNVATKINKNKTTYKKEKTKSMREIDMKNLESFNEIKTHYLEALEANGVSNVDEFALKILASIYASKSTMIVLDKKDCIKMFYRVLKTLGVNLYALDLRNCPDRTSIIQQILTSYKSNKNYNNTLNLYAVIGLNEEKSQLLAPILFNLDNRFYNKEIRLGGRYYNMPANIGFLFTVNNFELMKLPLVYREQSTIVAGTDILVESTQNPDIDVIEAFRAYTDRFSISKVKVRLKEEDWKMLDQIWNMQEDSYLSNKYITNIERLVTILGEFGFEQSKVMDVILSIKVIPQILPILIKDNKEETLKTFKQMLAKRGDDVQNALKLFSFTSSQEGGVGEDA